MPKQIGVIGASVASAEIFNLAERVGREIAKRGGILVCGGLGGVMEACARGAKSMGGVTVGILPTESMEEANPYIDIKIATAMSHARNAIIARSCDSLIAVGGGLGTVSEIALAVKCGKKVICLKTESIAFEFAKILGIEIAETPEEAVEKAFS